jgi:hypothetical protein
MGVGVGSGVSVGKGVEVGRGVSVNAGVLVAGAGKPLQARITLNAIASIKEAEINFRERMAISWGGTWRILTILYQCIFRPRDDDLFDVDERGHLPSTIPISSSFNPYNS